MRGRRADDASATAKTRYPRDTLFEAVVLYLREALSDL
jgi:hypothetical protein